MAGVRARCQVCDRQFRIPEGSTEDRCASCRSERVLKLPTSQPVEQSVHASTLDALRGADRLSTPLGVAALKLARELDEAEGVAAARIASEWSKVFAQSMDGAAKEADVVDRIFGATGS